MNGHLLELALAPALICIIYMYIRDKYEKEPIKMLFLGLVYGVYISFPIINFETALSGFVPYDSMLSEAFYNAFIVASLTEEGIKFIFLYFLVWRNPNFNEHFDGIVYATFISLGFAAIENVMYVTSPHLGGIETGISRALISVPGHALFGVIGGYYFAIAKYLPKKRYVMLFNAFFVPFLIHGIYDFILLSGYTHYMFIFIPFVIFMWFLGFRQMKLHIEKSPFKKRREL